MSWIACLALLTACKESAEQAQTRMTAEADAARPLIEAQMARYSRGAAAGNADTMLAMYAPDAVIMPPQQKLTSLDSLRAKMARIGPFQVSFATRSLTVDGALAVERGVWSAVLSPPGAPLAVVRDGKYMARWKMLNGEWRIEEHIWNDDYPAPIWP